MIRSVGPKNRMQSYVSVRLALRVLSDYDAVFSWHISSMYMKSLETNQSGCFLELQKVYQELEVLQAINAKLSNKAIDVPLVGGLFLLYWYLCNKIVKFGTSFSNKDGQRPKSHKTSVPNLCIGFVFYASKEALIKVNRAIKDKFGNGSRLEHVDCEIVVLEEFIISYFELMGFDYQREDIQKLKLLNVFLRS